MNKDKGLKQPVVLDVDAGKIPTLLKDIPQWIGWKVGAHKAGGKYDKLPVNRQGRVSSALDPNNHMTFDEVFDIYNKGAFSGIGFVLNGKPISANQKLLYLIGIDIDRCVTSKPGEQPILSDIAINAWEMLGQPYFEISPSNTGIRMFVLSETLLASGNNANKEMYSDKRYLTLTGQGKGEILEATEAVIKLHTEWFPKKQLQISKTKKSTFSKQNESAEETEAKILSALDHISADNDYDSWRNIVWAVQSSGLDNAESIARNWSETAPERYADQGFDSVWASFDAERGITLGTLFHYAQQNGWRAAKCEVKDLHEGDILNGKLFADLNCDKLKFVYETGELFKYTDVGWVTAPPGEAEASAKKVVSSIKQNALEAIKADSDSSIAKRKLSHASRSSFEPRIKAMISMARSEPGMTARSSDFDSNAYLLGVANGVLDLQKNILLQPSPERLVSMRACVAFESAAKCPNWLKFLESVQPDKEVQHLLQQLAGVILTGRADLQKLIVIYGHGANGKSTFIEVVAWLMGDYSHRIQTEMLMQHQRSPQGASPDIVDLRGRRLAYCNEVQEGKRLDEGRVKELTGGDTLTGRALYAKHNVTFEPTHNLIMVGNHKPEVHDTSNGMWRRMLVIPFEITIPQHKQDRHLIDKLKAEAPGILNWALLGLQSYDKSGLRIPKIIDDATTAYKDEEDILGEFIQEHLTVSPTARVEISDCYRTYRYWAENRGHMALAQSRFSRRLKDRGVNRDPGKRHYLGISLQEVQR